MSDIMSNIVSNSLKNPATGETYTFLRRSGETGGELLQLRWAARPGARVGEHVHPLQEDRFTVLEGTLTVSIDGTLRRCSPGEAVAVPAGARHHFANEGEEPVVATLELRPALRMEQVFEALAGLAREGRARDDGLPRNLLDLAVFAHEFRDEIRGARPPYPVQRMVLPPLAAIARRLGRRAHRPEYRLEVAGTS